MIIPDIIEQHWEEAGLLWGRRCAAVHNPSFSLQTLAELDERIEAHLDGLRVAGKEGWELCLKIATWEAPDEAFVAGVLNLEGSDETRVNGLFKRSVANPKLVRGLVSAIGWVKDSIAQSRISLLLTSESPVMRRIGIGAVAAHRLNHDGHLRELLKDPDAGVRARAFRAVGELGRSDLLPVIQSAAGANSEDCEFWSAWTVALLAGDGRALDRLKNFLAVPSRWQMPAAQVWFRRQPATTATELHRKIARKSERARLAINAAGIIGDPGLIPWLLQQMDDPANLRLAADAFQTITGADFVMDRLRMNSPPRPPVPEDSGADESPDPDADLIWPEAKAIRCWWDQRGAQFAVGTRYFLGKPISIEWLQEVLKKAQQHQRAAAVLEMASRIPGQPLFNITAPGFRQQQILGKVEAIR